MIRKFANIALQAALDAGGHYVDVRFEETDRERIVVRNGEVEVSVQDHSLGYGIRVLLDNAWGFAANFLMQKSDVIRTAQQAVSIARASAQVKKKNMVLAPNPTCQVRWFAACDIDPRTVHLQEKIDYLLQCDETMNAVKGITFREGAMEFVMIHKWFADSDGSWIEQGIPVSGVGIEASAVRGNDLQVRSYPNSFFGQYEGKGYELIHQWNPLAHAQEIAGEAVALLDAQPCPQGVKTLILDPTQLALQVHESCGHAVELDRVLGTEINDYGTSFLTLDKMNTFQYGSPMVTIVADPTLPGGLGSYAFDDEGVPAKRVYLVENGVFRNYLSSRETAAEIGQKESNSSMRAENFNRIPLIRMSNVNLEPGDSTLKKMISETDDGIFMAINKSYSIDDRRWQFQFGTEIGWLIKNGKLTEMVKNPIYAGTTPQFWRACDAIGHQDEWTLWGVPGCGKGQPDQDARVSHGCSPARFQNIHVGANSGR